MGRAPCLSPASLRAVLFLGTLHSETLRESKLDGVGAGGGGMGNDYLFNKSKKGSKPLKGLNSSAETGIL